MVTKRNNVVGSEFPKIGMSIFLTQCAGCSCRNPQTLNIPGYGMENTFGMIMNWTTLHIRNFIL